MLRFFVLFTLVFSISIFAASSSECRKYEAKFAHFKNVHDGNSASMKSYSMLMVKSYFDSIILECRGIQNYSIYVKLIPKIKKEWKYTVPEHIRNQPQNQWKY